MELKITKEKVLEAADKCGTAKEVLQTLFPEIFNEGKINEFTVGTKIQNGISMFIGVGVAPKGLEYRCLMIPKERADITTHRSQYGDNYWLITPKK